MRLASCPRGLQGGFLGRIGAGTDWPSIPLRPSIVLLKGDFPMKMRFIMLLFITLLSMPAWAALQTVTLSVPGMTCPTCPITIKVALNKVEGVSQIDVNYRNREAIVTFDDSQTSVAALTEATTNAGFPSSVKSTKADRE
jgi:mercuric ion binding protein